MKRAWGRMYLDPIHWVMDNSGLRLLQRDSKKKRQRMARDRQKREEEKEQKQTQVYMRDERE